MLPLLYGRYDILDEEVFFRCVHRSAPALQTSRPVQRAAYLAANWQERQGDRSIRRTPGRCERLGTDTVGIDTIRQIRCKFGRGKADIYQTWGTTETSGVITAQPWEVYVKRGSRSVGELCPNVTLRILDEHDQHVGEGERGELLVGGPILAQGYYNRPEVDAECFGKPPGFYRTGDIGVCKDGLVYIVDRKKELIKYKANRVAPAELEALLTSHPMVIDAAVIGVWDKVRQTEVPRGYVVRKQVSLTVKAVQAFVKDNLAPHKQLRGGVLFVDEIPKSASGKILRKDLRLKANKEDGLQARLQSVRISSHARPEALGLSRQIVHESPCRSCCSLLSGPRRARFDAMRLWLAAGDRNKYN